jgi:hypothetical protein
MQSSLIAAKLLLNHEELKDLEETDFMLGRTRNQCERMATKTL